MFQGNPASPKHSSWRLSIELLKQEYPDSIISYLDYDGKSPVVADCSPADHYHSLSFRDSVRSSKSANALSAGTRFFASKEYEELRFIALKLLNRNDLTGTFRLLEREVILQATVLKNLEILSTAAPNLLVFRVTPHQFMPYVTQQVANWLQIPTLFFQPVSICQGVIPRLDLDKHMTGIISTNQVEAERGLLQQQCRVNLERLQDKQDPKYMISHKNRDLKARLPLTRLLALRYNVKWMFKDRYPNSVDFSGHTRTVSIFWRFLKIFITRSLQNSLSDKISLTHGTHNFNSYAVFALHYEPERTSLPEGFPVTFQADAVVAARDLLPEDTQLLVKEHYSQASLAWRGFTGRSPWFYDLVESYPNTSWLRSSSSLVMEIANSVCVFTLTGTIALEAMFLGVPVVYFGCPWWAGAPGTMRFSASLNITDIESFKPASEKEIYTFFSDLAKETILPGTGSENLATIESRLGRLSAEFFSAEASGVVAAIRAALTPHTPADLQANEAPSHPQH